MVTVVVFAADYDRNGQGTFLQFVGRYVVGSFWCLLRFWLGSSVRKFGWGRRACD